MSELTSFPLSDEILDCLEHACGTTIGGQDEEGDRVLVGGEYTLTQLLDFLSGYDPSKAILVDPDFHGLVGNGELYEYPDDVYSERDVIRALVVEVRRLRAYQLRGNA